MNEVLKEDMTKMINVFGQKNGRNKYFFKCLISFFKSYYVCICQSLSKLLLDVFSFKDIHFRESFWMWVNVQCVNWVPVMQLK